jgi:hypothetical protein
MCPREAFASGIPRRDSPNGHLGPFSGYSFQAFRFAQRLSTAIRGTDEQLYTN